MDFEQVISQIAVDLRALRAEEAETKNAFEPRRGSRYVGQGADPSFVEDIANSGELRLAERETNRLTRKVPGGGLAGVFTKALAEGTGSSGGFLVPVEVSAEIVGLIRAASVVMSMGVTIVPVAKEMSVTSLSSGATAYYTAENSQIPVSEETFTQTALLRPKDLTAMVPVSLRLLQDADNPSVEQIVRRDLSQVMALRADLGFLQGTGTSSEPLGIRNWSGLTAAPSLGINGGTPTFSTFKEMVQNLRAINAPFRRPGWVMSPRTLGTIEAIQETSGGSPTGRYLANDPALLTIDPTGGTFTLLGYPGRTSGQVPNSLTTGTSANTSYVVFSSDWDEAYVGENTALQIDVSTEATYLDSGSNWVSAFQNKQAVFRALIRHDFALRRPALFSLLSGVRP